MKKYLFLSWFYKSRSFNRLLVNLSISSKPCGELQALYSRHEQEILELLKTLKLQGVSIITFFDKAYPQYLKDLDSKVWVLSAVGDLNLLYHENRISLVGSRKPDRASVEWVCENMSKVEKNTLIISGGAIGIDQVTHKAAHINNLRGLCVLPVGILEMYPKSLGGLVNLFLRTEKFLLVSQFHPKQKVCKSLFHPRNYLIAALSEKVVVVQAKEKSGTMVTAKFARDMGREVYALPASPWSFDFKGNVSLLEEGAYQIIDLNFIHL